MANQCPKCHTDNSLDSKFCKACATPLSGESEKAGYPTQTFAAPREELTTGSTFAKRYQIIEELGYGGMGKVYKVFDTEIKEKIALKLISPELSTDKNTIERFRNELKLARNISHKHICRMYDLNREGRSHYLTMEYIPGEDLKTMIRMSKQIRVGTAVCIAKQICEGLEEAHTQGVIHRDLKPNNIMLDRNGNVRILDFGIARSGATKGLTGRGSVIGTPEYMSPEQVDGKETDHRSDIYSLGIILYEMLTGRLPLEGENAVTLGIKHKTEIPEDPVKINPDIPKDLSLLILKCLAKNKEDRYQSAAIVNAELTQIEQGLPTAEKPVLPKKPLTSKEFTVQLIPKKLIIPAFVLLAAVLAAFFLLRPKSGDGLIPAPTDKPSLAVIYFENNSGNTGLDHWRSGLCELLITDLSQSKYLHVLSGDRIYSLMDKFDLLDRDKYTTADLTKVAAQAGANHILRGNYMTAGETFIIIISLVNAATGDVISSLREEGPGEESISGSVDKITRAVKAALNFSPQQIESDIDKDVGVVTTKYPEAYKYYVEGIKCDIKGDYSKVVEYMQKAVAVDPEFASAYHAISWASGNQGYVAEENKYLKKALELSGRLSAREKYLIEGAYYLNVEADYAKAEKALHNLVALYPDDKSGHNYLGVLYVRLWEDEKAIYHYGKAIEAGTEDVVIYTNLANMYLSLGMFDKQVALLKSYIDRFSDSDHIRRYLAESFRIQGKFDLALDELVKAEKLDPGDWMIEADKGIVYLYSGKLNQAEIIFKKLMQEKDPAIYGWNAYYLSSVYLLQGKFSAFDELTVKACEHAEENGQITWQRNWLRTWASVDLRRGKFERALQSLDQALELTKTQDYAQETSLNSTRVSVYARMQAFAKAEKAAEELKPAIKNQSENIKSSMRTYDFVMGMLALKKKKYTEAIRQFEKVLAACYFTTAIKLPTLEALGEAAYLAGDLERAQKAYTQLVQLETGRMAYGDIYVRGYYMLGKIFEKTGATARAIDNFTIFLDLWKDADPGLPEVEDAKTRLAVLRSS